MENYKFKDGKLFTGKLDSNGVEIYDGDRVSVSSAWIGFTCEPATVKYVNECAGFFAFYDKPDLNGKSVDGVNYNRDALDEFDSIVVIEE